MINKTNASDASTTICPSPESELLRYIKNNDSNGIITIIKANKALLEYEDPNTSQTVMCIACSNKGTHSLTVETLLDLGANLEGKKQWNPLHLAVANHNVDILKAILNKLKLGQINGILLGSKTALHSLVQSEEVKKNEQAFCAHVELLLKADINVNQGDSKNLSAIFWAAKYGCRHIIKCILEKSAKPVDLDSHKLGDESARDLIIKNNLFNGTLPEPYNSQLGPNLIFELVKQSKQEDLIAYLDSSTNSADFLNMDDGTSTLLQYSCDKGLQKIVVYLLNKNVDINLVTNINKKKPVEIAVSHDFHEIFALLLEHPEVTISAEVLCDLMKRFDEKKFENIDHKQYKKKIESYKKLVNLKDADSNTALHYSLQLGTKATTDTLLKLGASLAIKDKSGTMPIKKIRYEQLKTHLDRCVEFDKNTNEDQQDFWVAFDYSTLVPFTNSIRPDDNKVAKKSGNGEIDIERNVSSQRTDVTPLNPLRAPESEKMSPKEYALAPETEVINFMSRSQELKNLLTHPVIVTFLLMKWHKIRWLFYTNLAFYIIFVFSLFVYIFSCYSKLDNALDFCGVPGQISYVVLNMMFWMLVLRESFQMTISPKNYYHNLENWVEISLIFVTAIILYLSECSNDSRKELSSVAILLASLGLILMIGQHPKVSAKIVMLRTVSENFFTYLLYYSLLIIAFALSFNILFDKSTSSVDNKNQTGTDDNKNVFKNPGESLFKTIVMLTGEFETGSIDFNMYPFFSKLIFILFVFMITIILLNLLNGLAVSDTQSIIKDAELVGHITRAQHIFYVESMLLGNIFPRTLIDLFCCFANKQSVSYIAPSSLAKTVCLFTSKVFKLYVLPNNYGKILVSYEDINSEESDPLKYAKTCFYIYLDQVTTNGLIAFVKQQRQFEDITKDVSESSSHEETAITRIISLQAEMRELKHKMEQILLKVS